MLRTNVQYLIDGDCPCFHPAIANALLFAGSPKRSCDLALKTFSNNLFYRFIAKMIKDPMLGLNRVT